VNTGAAAPRVTLEVRALLGRAAAIAVEPLALLAVTLVAIVERFRTARRRRRYDKPRLIWGVEPLINSKYWSRAMAARGYETRTCVAGHYPAFRREDFDVYWDDFGSEGKVLLIRDWIVFAWALRHADVVIIYFDGGFLRGTRTWRFEAPLLRLAGKRLIVAPYGGDIAMPGHLGVLEEAMISDYPGIPAAAGKVRKRVAHYARWADVVIKNFQHGYMPRVDTFWPTQITIDTDRWAPAAHESSADGRGGEVLIAHSSNHRKIKGTQHLLDAVAELKADGLKVRLELFEGRSNEEVRDGVRRCDIYAEQFVAGYALAAIEAMSSGKPVLSDLHWFPDDVRAHPALRECPIVDTSPADLAENLRRLVEDPALRRELGRVSRSYALKYHSYEAAGATWATVIDCAWRRKPVPRELPVTEQTAE
jgi:glycosyltransferase involved in cell wall biosynthesis